jgi:hypothetical protein
MSSIIRIHIDYADGSTDEIELLPGGNAVASVYWLARKTHPTQELTAGAYSMHAIAGFLYQSALASRRTGFDFAFDFRNPKTLLPARDTSTQAA